MTIRELKQEIKGVFKPPMKKYYLGRIVHGSPYFGPMHFNKNVISVRRLKVRTEQELLEYRAKRSWLRPKEEDKFTNLPMVRRNKNWIVKLLGYYWYVNIGWPIGVCSTNGIAWKAKFGTPRYEWGPLWHLYFFRWQFCIWWTAPPSKDDWGSDTYYEMIIWYLHYSKKDLNKAKESWPWRGMDKQSTWDDTYLL